MSGALYYHFFQLRELLQIILTTFQAEPLSLFSEFSTIVMVDCSFSSYTYMNGLHSGPEIDKFYKETLSKLNQTCLVQSSYITMIQDLFEFRVMHSGPENLKKIQAKKLMKSNKSISQKN